MPSTNDSQPPVSRAVLVDAAFRVIASHPLELRDGRACHEVMANRQRPCSGCPVIRLRSTGPEIRPFLQVERIGPGHFEWVSVQRPEHPQGPEPCLECSRVRLGVRMSTALENLCSDLRFRAIGEHVELLANKVQGLSLGIELMRGRTGEATSERLLDAMAENCRDLVQEIERARLHLAPNDSEHSGPAPPP